MELLAVGPFAKCHLVHHISPRILMLILQKQLNTLQLFLISFLAPHRHHHFKCFTFSYAVPLHSIKRAKSLVSQVETSSIPER